LANYIDKMYMQIMGRHVDSQGLSAQQQGIAGNGRCAVDPGQCAGSQHRGAQQAHWRYYQLYLRRSVDQSGLMYWLNQYAAGFSDESVIAGLVTSAEYTGRVNHNALVSTLFLDLFGRPATSVDISYWSAVTSSLASQLVRSAEAALIGSTKLYQTYLGRSAAQSEVNYWLPSPPPVSVSDESIITAILSCDEYIGNASTTVHVSIC